MSEKELVIESHYIEKFMFYYRYTTIGYYKEIYWFYDHYTTVINYIEENDFMTVTQCHDSYIV